jgi:hypothetical protein
LNYPGLTLGLIGVGLFVPRSYLIYPASWAFLQAIFWYTVGSYTTRWGLSAYLTLLTTAFLSYALLIDRTMAAWELSGESWLNRSWIGVRSSWLATIPARLSPNIVIRVTLAGLALFLCFKTGLRIRADGWGGVLPGWINKEQAKAVLVPGGLDAYLGRTRKGYEIYRFIATHDLKTVLQPFDYGARLYEAAYSGGRNDNWILPWHQLPDGPADFDSFLRSNGVKYFIYRESLTPVELERIDQASPHPKHVESSYQLLRYLLPRSHRILVDAFGWELYAVDAADAPEQATAGAKG